MKIKTLDGYNIDLREVTIIGPLTNNANSRTHDGCSISGLGCYVWFFSGREPLWLNMATDKIDPYQLDDSKNALARATANQNYNLLVDQWNATD